MTYSQIWAAEKAWLYSTIAWRWGRAHPKDAVALIFGILVLWRLNLLGWLFDINYYFEKLLTIKEHEQEAAPIREHKQEILISGYFSEMLDETRNQTAKLEDLTTELYEIHSSLKSIHDTLDSILNRLEER